MADTELLDAEEPFRLPEYLSVIRHRKWSIIAVALVAVLAALFYAQTQTPMYKSQTKVVASNPLSAIQAGTTGPNAVDVAAEQTLVTSTPVTECAALILARPATEPPLTTTSLDSLCHNVIVNDAAAAGTTGIAVSPAPSASAKASVSPKASASAKTSASPKASAAPTPTALTVPPGFRHSVSVSVVPSTNVMVISFSSPHAAFAQRGAEAFAQAYVSYKRVKALTYLDSIRAPLVTQKNDLTAQQAKLQADILAAYATVPPNIGRAASDQQQLSAITQRVNELNAALDQTDPRKLTPPTIALDAPLPQAPSSPNKPLIAALGLFVGLVFGVGVAFLRERFDTRIRGRQDVERVIGAPVLAVVPHIPDWRRRGDAKLITVDAPKSSAAETYRSLRTAVQFAASQRDIKSLLLVSGLAGEGKSTTAANLAVSLADAGKRVILISADLRRPRLHRFFKVENENGLSTILSDGALNTWDALSDPGIDNVRLIPSGPPPARPAELLQSARMQELLLQLREVADFLILDSAPVGLVADALGLASLVDAVLVVADAQRTSVTDLGHAREQLEQVNAPILGAILNNFDPSQARGYGYGYRYGYGRYRYGYGYGYGYVYGGYPTEGEINGERRGRRRGRRGQPAPAERERAEDRL